MVTLIPSIFRHLGRKPVTRRYPFEKRAAPPSARGHLDIDIAACIFCGACQKRCPANALAVSRDPKSWSVNHYACIVCGYCLEVCPKKCLVLHNEHFKPG